jgi:hypothetical protein
VLTVYGPVTNPLLTLLNPFYSFAQLKQAPPTLDMATVLNSPPATGLAADGVSAAVLVYQSKSSQQVTFELSASGTGLSAGTAVGSLGQFDPNYLAYPNAPSGNLQSLPTTYTYGPDAAGNYFFLALLWGPNGMPVPNVPLVNISVTATQQGVQGPASQTSIALEPPPCSSSTASGRVRPRLGSLKARTDSMTGSRAITPTIRYTRSITT